MIFDTTGEITENFYMIGHPCAPIYLLDDGPSPAIFDSGFSIMGTRYVDEIRAVLSDRHPAFLFLTHSHFDHCGSTGFLKRAFPRMKILVSPLAQAVLKKPRALELIRKLCGETLPLAAGLGLTASNLTDFIPFQADRTVSDGDTISLHPNLSVRVFETPGHTRDSLSFYIPERRILLSGEALGIPDKTGYIISECLSDYDQYTASLKKLESLKKDILCLGHYKVFTGDDAGRYIEESRFHCVQFKELVGSFLREENGDMDRVMQRFKNLEYKGKREDAHPEAAYFINLNARIKAVLASREDTTQSS